MNVIEALIVIGGIIGVAAVGLSLLGRITGRWSAGLYALIVISLVILTVSGYNAMNASTAIEAVWCARLGAMAVVVASTSFFFLVQGLSGIPTTARFNRAIQVAVIVYAAVIIGVLLTSLVFPRAYLLATGGIFVVATSGITLLTVFFSMLIVLSGYQLFSQAREVYRRRHGVIDTRLVAARAISYLFTLATTALVFCLAVIVFAWIFGLGGTTTRGVLIGPATVVAALAVALAFQPIRKAFNKKVDQLLYKDNYSISQFTVQISQTLNSTNDLRTLLERTATVIASTLKARQAFFFVHLPEDHYMIAGTDHHSKVSPSEFADMDSLSPQRNRPLLIAQFETAHPMRRMMVSHRLEVILPLYKGDLLVGSLCLGRSKGKGFTNRDLRALRVIADELTIAIHNALSVDEVRKLNDTLEQRIGSATKELRMSNAQLQRLDEAKDEFISMASHQLRTPLTSIKGYISMMLDGDVGKISKDQRHMLNEAFVSSERMVRLIGDFLNVSRLQTGKFVIEKHPVDLARLVEREVDGLAQNASARGMKFVYKKPKGLPAIDLDENKIQQVVMNFSDNAIYYSKENSKIVVSLKKVGAYVEFKVVDTGIGVPKSEQEQLFNKFFRATNARRARPDGTGVGLFLAKKVIDDHDGDIIFESKEGKGSTFGFRLPLPK